MTTVFLSGSRKITRLNDMIRLRIKNMLDQGFRIVVGDANGADKALQSHLADRGYQNVTVFCAGRVCRNNVGRWNVRQIAVDSRLKGRAYYAQKDKEMAAQANYGFVLWDGSSAGSINNVLELLKSGKKAVVYLSPEKRFVNIASSADVISLTQKCESTSCRTLRESLAKSPHINERQRAQGLFGL